ncbi:hypothetical protein Acj9p088 [Acinetobacter phage Acj9]|uniref:Conserved hypothetical phage protein n=1 Tax=Acinetobacter phage Acj9 TaxID=760939 RepID=E5EPM2_9CAUD|nr:hypothetical protein Acj9p088 [Acinetobacter phage Acj9]ADG59988.1 conserved hypothetical phage protein [Acinetobacter phage Acj9]
MRKLIVPIFSMRSYETGLYSVLKDGNFQLQLARSMPGDLICVPYDSSDTKELGDLFPNHSFVQLQYPKNALETRETFWSMNQVIVDDICESFNCDMIVTDITGYAGRHKVIFNFNITKDPENPRAYIDKFIDIDVESVNRSFRTFVLNWSQMNYLIQMGADSSKLRISQKVINRDIIDAYLCGYAPINLGSGIFHPFRISDPCYDFDDVYQHAQNRMLTLFVTDPNDTLDKDKYPAAVLFKPNKRDYYRVLASGPTIIYNENPDKVFHPGLAEFIYFGANIICGYNVPKRKDILIDKGLDVWLD